MSKIHPFNYAYNVQNSYDLSALLNAYTWAAKEFGHSAPMPDVLVANHEHMQRAAAQSNHCTHLLGQVYGWYSQTYKTVYISDKLHPGKNKKSAAIVVHEFIHYMQDLSNRENIVDKLEEEADRFMVKYLLSR